MVFTRFVEVGRVCCINYGPLKNKLCVIVGLVDGSRLLVQGPSADSVPRHVINVKRISLTDITIKITPNERLKGIAKAWKEANVEAAFGKSALGRTLRRREIKASMNDFDRFKLASALRIRNKAIKAKVAELK